MGKRAGGLLRTHLSRLRCSIMYREACHSCFGTLCIHQVNNLAKPCILACTALITVIRKIGLVRGFRSIRGRELRCRQAVVRYIAARNIDPRYVDPREIAALNAASGNDNARNIAVCVQIPQQLFDINILLSAGNDLILTISRTRISQSSRHCRHWLCRQHGKSRRCCKSLYHSFLHGIASFCYANITFLLQKYNIIQIQEILQERTGNPIPALLVQL